MSKRLTWVLFAAVGLVLLSGCGDTNFYLVEHNSPPLILVQGPDFPADGRLEFLHPDGSDYHPELWVAVGDPDGLDDISAVCLDIGSIRIIDMIIRPSDGSASCLRVDFSHGVIPTDSILPLPYRLPSLHNERMYIVRDGVYGYSPFSIPDPRTLSPVVLGPPIRGCAYGGASWTWFSLNPPAVETATDVFLTRLVIQFTGISVTVYDAAGNTESTSYPDLQITYSSDAEEAVAP